MTAQGVAVTVAIAGVILAGIVRSAKMPAFAALILATAAGIADGLLYGSSSGVIAGAGAFVAASMLAPERKDRT